MFFSSKNLRKPHFQAKVADEKLDEGSGDRGGGITPVKMYVYICIYIAV